MIGRRGGFTLLEMVIVLGIIAMILGGAIYSMKHITEAAKVHQAVADLKSFDSALGMYHLNAGCFPTTQQGFKALVEKPTLVPAPVRWAQVLSKVPVDPWNNEYIYRFPGKKRAGEYEIISKGRDGVENTPDDISSQDE